MEVIMNGFLAALRRGAAVAAVGAACAGTAGAAQLGVLAMAESVGGYRGNEIAYINGGITRDEADALRNAAPNFPLQLVFARRGQPGANDEFVADASIAFFDEHGNRVAALDGQGPIFLARLPDGRYTIVAEFDGRRQTRHVVVQNGRTQKVSFLWG
jgi:hypothetical protein